MVSQFRLNYIIYLTRTITDMQAHFNTYKTVPFNTGTADEPFRHSNFPFRSYTWLSWRTNPLLTSRFHFVSGVALYWIPYGQMPEHISVTERVCGKWVANLGFFLPGKCGGPEYFYGAYGGIKYKKRGPKVSPKLLFVFDQLRQILRGLAMQHFIHCTFKQFAKNATARPDEIWRQTIFCIYCEPKRSGGWSTGTVGWLSTS